MSSDHFRGGPHRQLVAEPQLRGCGHLSSDHHRRERQIIQELQVPEVPEERYTSNELLRVCAAMEQQKLYDQAAGMARVLRSRALRP